MSVPHDRHLATTLAQDNRPTNSASQPCGAIECHNGHVSNEHLARLRGFILLGGLVRPTQLSTAIGHSVLDLPVDGRRSLLDQWQEQAAALAQALHIGTLPVRVVIDQQSISPNLSAQDTRVAMSIERDKASFRGTGGVLHDLSSDYQEQDYLLVANAAQMLLEPLPQLAADLAANQADVAVISPTHGVPSGLMLVRCGILRSIAPIGFVDMKEQVLPRIASSHCVRVVKRSKPVGLPIRTLSNYINAIRAGVGGDANANDAFAEGWQSTFSIIQDDTQVDPTARVHDSVVLRGARVERGALLVRSVVCSNGVTRRDVTVVDRLISPNNNLKQ